LAGATQSCTRPTLDPKLRTPKGVIWGREKMRRKNLSLDLFAGFPHGSPPKIFSRSRAFIRTSRDLAEGRAKRSGEGFRAAASPRSRRPSLVWATLSRFVWLGIGFCATLSCTDQKRVGSTWPREAADTNPWRHASEVRHVPRMRLMRRLQVVERLSCTV
jgi:hypothetical protein